MNTVFQGTKKETKTSKPEAAAESKPAAKKPPPKSAAGGGGGGASKGKGKGGAVGGVGEPPEVSEANVLVRNTYSNTCTYIVYMCMFIFFIQCTQYIVCTCTLLSHVSVIDLHCHLSNTCTCT